MSRIGAVPQPRRFTGDLGLDTPRHWFRGNAVLTHMLNTYTVLVPGNERYYMRHLRRALARLRDTDLRHRTQRFIRQEGQHGIAHEKYWAALRAQGLRYERFLRLTDLLSYRLLEALFPLSIQLSVIAAVEHINTYLGRVVLSADLLRDAEARQRELFYWHLAEEIEHKAVAFDVYHALVASYPLRVLGMLLAAPVFYAFNFAGTVLFCLQQRCLLRADWWLEWFRFQFTRERVAWRSLRYLVDYLRPGFHPDLVDDRTLLRELMRGPLKGRTEILPG